MSCRFLMLFPITPLTRRILTGFLIPRESDIMNPHVYQPEHGMPVSPVSIPVDPVRSVSLANDTVVSPSFESNRVDSRRPSFPPPPTAAQSRPARSDREGWTCRTSPAAARKWYVSPSLLRGRRLLHAVTTERRAGDQCGQRLHRNTWHRDTDRHRHRHRHRVPTPCSGTDTTGLTRHVLRDCAPTPAPSSSSKSTSETIPSPIRILKQTRYQHRHQHRYLYRYRVRYFHRYR